MSIHLDRAQLLFQQSRHELAEQELRQELAARPESAVAHALLALCLAERKQFSEASSEAQLAIHQEPELPFAYYAHARILLDRNRPKEAEQAIHEAIRLDPHHAGSFALLAAIRMADRRWAEMLTAAEEGLANDPEHVACTNLRAMALVKLGRNEQAGATIDAALARNPDNAETHANQGWALLHSGEHLKAMEHFREALRLDPENEWARAGIVEALKSRHFIYRIMLRYFLWMSKLSDRAQWGIVIGGFLGFRFLRGIARNNPELAVWVWPLIGLYIAFAVMTWLAQPLFDLLLRINRFGRLALSREQIVASNWIGGCLLLALVLLAADIALGFFLPIPALMVALFMLPLSAVFRCEPGWPRRWMLVYTLGMAIVGIAGLLGLLVALPQVFLRLPRDAVQPLLRFGLPSVQFYFLAAFVSQFVANILMQMRPKR